MNCIEIIDRKKKNQVLTKEEIDFFIKGYTQGSIPDYQAAALIMAIYLNGMTRQELTDLTLAMAYSGDVLDLSSLGTVVDKHSTGGVGDKVTLILMPIMASLGVPVAKMSGRGLGFTGGTIDKLESIPYYRTNLSENELIEQVKEIGICLMGQTLNLAPADRKLYALRDAISCTDSIPLIASSIMSKKLAAGASKIVLDVTCGSGAFMKTLEEARELSYQMKRIGELAQKETVCIITDMEEPLGSCIGNSLEMEEAIQALNGNMAKDVEEVVYTLGMYLLKLAGKGDNLEENKQKMIEAIQTGKAYQKLKDLVQKQGGDVSYIEKDKFPKAKWKEAVYAEKEGYITKLPAEEVGKLSSLLGAGRIKKEDDIDLMAGIVLQRKIGDKVKKGDVLAVLHTNQKEVLQEAKERLAEVYQIEKKLPKKKKMILEVVE